MKFIDKIIAHILIEREYKKVSKKIKKSLKNTWLPFTVVLYLKSKERELTNEKKWNYEWN